FFFLRLRIPLTSPLFPYTTLFRSDPVHALGGRATFVWRYWEHAAAELRARELWSIYEDMERPLIPVLALMERHGIRVDPGRLEADRKSTRLNFSHDQISYAVFCLK